MSEGRVVLGAQGVRSPDWAGRGVGRAIARTVEAVGRLAPGRVAGADLGAFESPVEPHDLDGLDPAPVIVDPMRRPAAGPLVYHVLAPFERGPLERVWPAWARAADVALVVTVYDLIPLRHERQYLADPAVRAAYRLRLELLRSADALCTLSAAVAEDLVALAGMDERRVRVCGGGPSREPAPADPRAPAGLDLVDGAVVAVLGEEYRKNTAGLLDGYGRLPAGVRARMPLLLCGLDPARPRELPEGARVLPRLSEDELAALQRHCRATIHPALDEGFGLPVLDALAAGGGALVSDIPVLTELVPDPGARFDPRSPAAIAAALGRLDDAAFLAGLRERAAQWAAPHTWEATAGRLLEAYDAAFARRRVPPRRRARLAVITPLPPQRTGVAAFERRRLEALAELADVDAFAERADEAPAAPVPGVRVLDAGLAAPAAQVEGYDAPVLHVIGNSPYHVGAWRHLMEHGGDVLLHDVRLVGLYGILLDRGLVDAQAFAEAVGSGDERRLGCGPVVDRAHLVLVHSPAARRLVLAERPERAGDVRVVPLGTRAPAPPTDPRHAREVAAFGFVKDPERLARAFAALLEHDPSIRAAIVGGPHPSDEQRLRALLDELGVNGAVEITGWVDEPSWRRRLQTATVALQLREGWNGEASASVSDCLAAGVPTIVNDVGAYDELPDEALVKLPAGSDPGAVARAVAELIDDEPRRERLSTAARSFSRCGSARQAARALLDAVLAG